MRSNLRGIAFLGRSLAQIEGFKIHHQTWRCFAAAPNQMALIKQLREKTGAPIADVKSALQQAEWDLEKASQELRKKGLAAANKKASRHAAEGLVGLAISPTAASIIEINSETDFVARNDQFRSLVSSTASSVLFSSSTLASSTSSSTHEIDIDALRSTPSTPGSSQNEAKNVDDTVAEVAGIVRENIKLRRGFLLSISPGSHGVLGSYIHAGVAPGLGRIASVVKLEYSEKDNSVDVKIIQEFAQKLAMHIVGALPQYLDPSAVPSAALDAERAVLREQAARTGKPDNIIEKMVQGRLNKFYEEVCLLEQPYILDDKKKVKDMVHDVGKVVGADDLRATAFVRVQVGQGLEEQQSEKKDFATEVAETLHGAST